MQPADRFPLGQVKALKEALDRSQTFKAAVRARCRLPLGEQRPIYRRRRSLRLSPDGEA